MPGNPIHPSFWRRYVWVPIVVMALITVFGGGRPLHTPTGLTAALPTLLREANAQPQHASPAPAMHALANDATRPADLATTRPTPTAATAPAPAAGASGRTKNDGTLHRVDFDELSSFRWVDPPLGAWNSAAKKSAATRPVNSIPPEVRSLDNQTVAIKGFMYPLDAEKGRTREFLLVRVVPACMYCNPPRTNEYIVVKTDDSKGVPVRMDDAITVTGTLTVGEEYEDGVVTSIYRLHSTAIK